MSPTTVDEEDTVLLYCQGDRTIIDRSNSYEATLLINGSPGENVVPDKSTYQTRMRIEEASYTLHRGDYVCQITYRTKEMGDVTVTSEATVFTVIGTV